MANKKKKQGQVASKVENKHREESIDKPVTLKDMLGSATVAKLKQHADALKQEEAQLQEKKRAEAEAARIAQQKANDNDFEYLLKNSSMDWKKHK